jgi:hypothetical protein
VFSETCRHLVVASSLVGALTVIYDVNPTASDNAPPR